MITERDELALLASARRHAQRRLTRASEQVRQDIARATDLGALVRRHPLIMAGSAVALGFIAVKTVQHALRDEHQQVPAPASLPGDAGGGEPPRVGMVRRLFNELLIPLIIDCVVRLLRAEPRASAHQSEK